MSVSGTLVNTYTTSTIRVYWQRYRFEFFFSDFLHVRQSMFVNNQAGICFPFLFTFHVDCNQVIRDCDSENKQFTSGHISHSNTIISMATLYVSLFLWMHEINLRNSNNSYFQIEIVQMVRRRTIPHISFKISVHPVVISFSNKATMYLKWSALGTSFFQVRRIAFNCILCKKNFHTKAQYNKRATKICRYIHGNGCNNEIWIVKMPILFIHIRIREIE